MEVGGWVQVSLGIFFCGKSSQNSPKPVLIFWSSIPCLFCLYASLKVVGYYDFCVLSMSVMGFQKKLDGVRRWCELYPICLGFLEFFNFANPLICRSTTVATSLGNRFKSGEKNG